MYQLMQVTLMKIVTRLGGEILETGDTAEVTCQGVLHLDAGVSHTKEGRQGIR